MQEWVNRGRERLRYELPIGCKAFRCDGGKKQSAFGYWQMPRRSLVASFQLPFRAVFLERGDRTAVRSRCGRPCRCLPFGRRTAVVLSLRLPGGTYPHCSCQLEEKADDQNERDPPHESLT